MRIKFHHWFRNKHNWWFAILPEVTVAYASLGGITSTTINIGWLFWTMVIHIDKVDKDMTEFFANNKEE